VIDYECLVVFSFLWHELSILIIMQFIVNGQYIELCIGNFQISTLLYFKLRNHNYIVGCIQIISSLLKKMVMK